MSLWVKVTVAIKATDEELKWVGQGTGGSTSGWDTTPLADKVEKVLRSEFGPRVGAVSTEPPYDDGDYLLP